MAFPSVETVVSGVGSTVALITLVVLKVREQDRARKIREEDRNGNNPMIKVMEPIILAVNNLAAVTAAQHAETRKEFIRCHRHTDRLRAQHEKREEAAWLAVGMDIMRIPEGPRGRDGLTGSDGRNGATGATGEPGKSAAAVCGNRPPRGRSVLRSEP